MTIRETIKLSELLAALRCDQELETKPEAGDLERMNTRALLRATVRHTLESGNQFKWQKQGLGMLRLYLSPEVRLHIWDSSLRVPNVSVAHDHPWDFRSYVISGKINQVRLKEEAPCLAEPFPRPVGFNEMMVGEHGWQLGLKVPYMRTTIRCGPGGCDLGDYVPVTLACIGQDTVTPGSFYEQKADEVHISMPEDGTVTLVERHFRADTEHAKVYFMTDKWVSAEPGPANWEEVEEVVATALRNWNA